MTDRDWDLFIGGLVYGAGPRRAREILEAEPDLRARLSEPSEAARRVAEHRGDREYLESDLRAKTGACWPPSPPVDTHPVFAGRSADPHP